MVHEPLDDLAELFGEGLLLNGSTASRRRPPESRSTCASLRGYFPCVYPTLAGRLTQRGCDVPVVAAN